MLLDWVLTRSCVLILSLALGPLKPTSALWCVNLLISRGLVLVKRLLLLLLILLWLLLGLLRLGLNLLILLHLLLRLS